MIDPLSAYEKIRLLSLWQPYGKYAARGKHPASWKMGQNTPLFKKMTNWVMQTIGQPFTVLPALNNIYKRPLAAHAKPKDIVLFCLILWACIGCSTVLNVMDQCCFERHLLGADEVINKVRRLCIYKLNSWRVCQTRVYYSQTVFDWKQFARHSFSLFVGVRLSPQTSKKIKKFA